MNIDDSTLREIYRTMIRIRTFENAVRQLIKEGKLSHLNFYTGGEAVAATVSAYLGPKDQIGSTHRPIGHLIAKGCDMKKILSEIAAKQTGYNKGKGGPYHIFDPKVGALGANGIVGGSVPMCAGYALANQLRDNGKVSVSYFGEGASNQGSVQETLNLAACWKLPMVFVCENSSPEVQTMLGHEIDYPQLSIDNVGDRGVTYGMPGSTHEGWDVLNIYHIVGKAINRSRSGEGPTLLEFKIHRLGENAEDSPYCPIRSLKKHLISNNILDEESDNKLREKVIEEVKDAVDFAIGSPEPDLLDAYSDIFIGGS
ncbi:MAG: thiamine pyrophosphate-dependent dehydrogenase E1 component subunit alpha [Promethearchaeota archaeon]